MSKFFALARDMYLAGHWNRAMLDVLVKKKRITAAERDAIVAEAEDGHDGAD